MPLKRIKILISSTIFAIITLLSTQSYAGVDGTPFEGVYLGLVTTQTSFESSVSHLARTDLTDTSNNNLVSRFNNVGNINNNNSYGGGFLVGYGLNYGPVYIAAEGGLIIEHGNTTFSDGTHDVKISKSNTIDLNLRAGITIADRALLYGLIGFSGANLKSRGLDAELDNGRDFNERITHLRYGGGVEVGIFENIAARLEYTLSKGNSATMLDGADEFTFKPESSRIMFSLVLHMY